MVKCVNYGGEFELDQRYPNNIYCRPCALELKSNGKGHPIVNGVSSVQEHIDFVGMFKVVYPVLRTQLIEKEVIAKEVDFFLDHLNKRTMEVRK